MSVCANTISPRFIPINSRLTRAITTISFQVGGLSSVGLCNAGVRHRLPQVIRTFTSTPQTRLKEVFLEPDHDKSIKKTRPAWPHPGFDLEQIRLKVHVEHRPAKDFSDYVALGFMRVLRWGTDLATGYHHDIATTAVATTSTPTDNEANGRTAHVAKAKKYRMSEKKWLTRFIFLESVAGVPGMVAGMLRHLRSMRSLKRDNGWIETLLEESFNERMHLLTFLKIAEPGWFMKVMIIGAQGVFFNSLFISYLISPRTVHRFVGYLEEEAVMTYGLAIQDLEEGKLPKWETMQAPDLAVEYWKMPEGHRTMHDLLWYIRADESKHREVNHTLANLKQATDANPFVSEFKDNSIPHPGKGIEHTKGIGWERNEVI